MGQMRNLFSQWGIEFESEIIGENEASSVLRNNSLGSLFSTTHDASVNSDWFKASGLVFESRPPESLNHNSFQAGSEIVSKPLEFDVAFDVLKKLTSMLESYGEKERSYRGSVHFHIDTTANVKLLRNLIWLGMHLEDVFYYIGGQGYPHRGTKVNQFLYCRPITQYGPTVVASNCGNVQVFTCSDLLQAKTMSEFYNRLGGACNNGVQHMHPARYFWLNFYSLLAHETLEFRVFNKTLNPLFLYAELMFCRHFLIWAVKNTFNGLELSNLGENSLYDDRSKKEVLTTFNNFCNVSSFDPYLTDILANIISQTPEITISPGYVHTHVRFDCSYDTSYYSPTKIPSNLISRVQVDDIHARRGERG